MKRLWAVYCLVGTSAVVLTAKPSLSAAETEEVPRDAGLSAMDLSERSLEELLSIPLDIASKKSKSLRETPAVVTVLTREEIIASGARDLIDVLRLVPGFGLGVDLHNTIGVGFRGNWGHEGKILLLIDGQAVNENFVGTTQLASHYPLANISSIEIIRGPGSAMYGGVAELAVVSMKTRGAGEKARAGTTFDYGTVGTRPGLATAQASLAQKLSADSELRLEGYLGQSWLSRDHYRDINGTEVSLADSNTTRPVFVHGSYSNNGLKLGFVYDDYRITAVDGGREIVRELEKGFTSYLLDASYALHPLQGATITPALSYHRHLPWRQVDRSAAAFVDVTTERYDASLTASYDLDEWLNLALGAEAFNDRARLNGFVDGSRTELGREAGAGPRDEVSYLNIAGYSEVMLDSAIANIAAGARYEWNDQFGSSFVPRAALTRLLGPVHLKLLYSWAFKAPVIANIVSNDSIKPERTQVLELEAGVQAAETVFVSVNTFDIKLTDPIVYYTDTVLLTSRYQNMQRSSTRGVEVDCRLVLPGVTLDANYSLYRAYLQGEASGGTRAPGHPGSNLAFPNHKVALSARFSPMQGLQVSPSAVFESERFGYASLDPSGAPVLKRMGPRLLANIFVSYNLPIVEGLTFGVGGYNLVGVHDDFVQPYDGKHAPLPGPGREIVARLSYDKEF